MIGQHKILDGLEAKTFSSFPNSLILCGDSGCGKHLLCSIIQEKFNDIEFIYVDSKINYDFVEKCYLSNIPKIYVLNAEELSVREQNAILKLFEEPPSQMKLILIIENLSSLLPTIINRAVIWKFEEYSKKELSQFLKNPDDLKLLDFVTTPGQVLSLNNETFDEMTNLAELIVNKINKASISNTLSLCNRFKFKSTDEGFDLLIFSKILKQVIFEHIKAGENIFSQYKLVSDFITNLKISSFNKKYLFENFLMKYKKL